MLQRLATKNINLEQENVVTNNLEIENFSYKKAASVLLGIASATVN